MSRKIGFWAVFAIVTGSQIGSGIFMLPASLAPFGSLSILGWLISAAGAIALSLVFAALCAKLPQTGGPHVYVKQAFGNSLGFFTGWTYWVISWVSTTAVVIACVGYLSPFLGHLSPLMTLGLEIGLVFLITALNLKGLKTAGRAEFVLTILKFIPLVVLPVAGLFFFQHSNLIADTSNMTQSTSSLLAQVTLLTLWGFIGLESATTAAGSVENPSKTIPKAIVFGTLCVAILYILNSLGIMGLIPGNTLAHSKAPYVDAAQIMFGNHWAVLISLIAAVVCIGTLNAWILTSGQVSLGLAEDKLMPEFFAQKNKNGAPIWGLLISSLGIIPLLVLTNSASFAQQITTIIDISVTDFLFVYLICTLAFFKLVLQKKQKMTLWQFTYGSIATLFCLWIISQTPARTLLVSASFVISGLPLYLLWYCRKNPVLGFLNKAN